VATSKDLGVKLAGERQAFALWFDGFKNAEGQLDMPAEKIDEFHTRNDAVSGLQKSYQDALVVDKSAADNALANAPQGRPVEPVKDSGPAETKEQVQRQLKRAFDDSAPLIQAYKDGRSSSAVFHLPMSLKTLMTTADMAPHATRMGAFGSALYYGNVEDLFMSGKSDSKSIDYYVQTTDTDNTAAVAEGSAPTDSAFSYTLVTDPIETVSDWIPVTRESLDDNAYMMSRIQGLLAARLQKKSSQIMLSGTGVTPIPTGVAVRTGVQTQAKGADNAFDAIHKGITLVEVTGESIADALCIHPTDWQNIRLTRTADGLYILGNPSDEVALNLWGLPVRKTIGVVAAGTAGTALVGAFSTQAEIVNRSGLTVEISTEHSTFATERKVAIILSRRFAVAGYRPNAFAKVTGL